jgi:phenylalanyl-tRNA synthetase beta chain
VDLEALEALGVERGRLAARLADDLTSIGLACDGIDGAGDDAVLEMDITTNRVDAMNMMGLAREIAAFYKVRLRPFPTDFPEDGSRLAASALRIEIEAPELCSRFAARVFDVRVGPSPDWLRRRLELAGQRSISNLVDLTNYVMLETGQPSHAFDLARVPGGVLRARMAKDGESVKTLDGVDRTLPSMVGVVSCETDALAIAGIMGGASSEISDDTQAVALEAAHWNPLVIRRAAKALGMRTEASHRFERGADPRGPGIGIARLSHLLVKGKMGSVRTGLIDVVARPHSPRTISVRIERVRSVIGATASGVPIDADASRDTLRRLGFDAPEPAGHSGAFEVSAPSWRGDVTREIDVIEEIARFFGLKNIARTVPPARRPAGLSPRQRTERALRTALSEMGFHEVIHLTFTAFAETPSSPTAWSPARLANPLSTDQDALRTSLVLPGLIRALAQNQRHDLKNLALFEIGRTFRWPARAPTSREPQEAPLVALALSGSSPRGWAEKTRALDFFDLKRAIEDLFERFGPRNAQLRVDPSLAPPFLHPGRSAGLIVDGFDSSPGCFGEIHPDVAARFEIKSRSLVAEIGLDLFGASDDRRFRPFSKFPSATRDISFLAPPGLVAESVLGLVREQAGPLARNVRLIDRFAADGQPVSLAVSIEFQHEERTLESAEVDAAIERVRSALTAAGGVLRGV